MALKHHDLVTHTKKYKGELHEFFLDMSSWRKFKTRYSLNWQKLRFREDSHSAVPKLRGIYTFTVELSPAKLPSHGYIMYMGIPVNAHDRVRGSILHPRAAPEPAFLILWASSNTTISK